MRTQSEDTDEQAEMVQIELLRQSTVSRRLTIVFSLSESAISLARRAIRLQNPNLADRDLLLRFTAIHYRPELAEKAGVHLKERSG